MKVSQRRVEVDVLVTKLKTENNRAEGIINETEKKLAEKQEEVDQLILKIQNQLTEKPISQYKAIFADQARTISPQGSSVLACGWRGVATAVFFASGSLLCYQNFWKSEGTQLSETLQNLFTKGFCTFTDLRVA